MSIGATHVAGTPTRTMLAKQKILLFFLLENFPQFCTIPRPNSLPIAGIHMNWNNHATFSPAVLRSALLLCALFFPASTAPTNANTLALNEDKLLIIGDGKTPTTATLDNNELTNLTDMLGMTIENEGTLHISPGTMVYLGGGYVALKGTLQLESTLGTGIYSSTKRWDGVNLSDLQPDKITNLVVDGGTIKITKGVDNVLFANTINVSLGTGGGTIDIAAGVTLEAGTINGQTGDVLKTGEGTLRAGAVSIKDYFVVRQGNVVFLDGASVGQLHTSAGTVISGLQADGKSKSDLTVIGGGKIEGTLQNIDRLLLGSDSFTFVGGSHTVGTIDIVKHATLEITAGTNIQLGSKNTTASYDDMIVEGRLRLSSAAGTLGKENPGQQTHITLVGTTNSDGDVVGGIVEVYKNDPYSAIPEVLKLDSLHTQIIGMTQIKVQSGVTFQSGKIDIHPSAEGAHIIVTGSGTYQAAEVNIGTGYFVVEKGSTMDFLNTVTAGALISDANTRINAYGNAEFGAVNLSGTYDGNDHNVTIQKGGWITGNITGVKELTVGHGTLYLAVNDGSPTISAEKLIADPATTQIRTVADTSTGTYRNVIEITGNDTDTSQLLAVLNASHTALYRPEWSQSGALLRSQTGTFLSLKLNILTVNEYIDNVWGKSGKNIGNIGWLIEDISSRNATFREYLEGLPDAQLQSVIRNAMAGELAGNAYRIAMHQPAHSVFRHLDTVVPLRSPFQQRNRIRGQVREGFNVWFNPYGQAERGDDEADTFDGYKLSRYGFYLGGDVDIYNRAVFGAFFGYAAPNVKSDLGKISADDYSAGVYLRMPSIEKFVVNMMIGFGKQSYTYKNSFRKSDFRGDSFFGSVELSRPTAFSRLVLTPLVSMDFQSAQMNSFIAYDPLLGGVLVEPDDMSSAMVRVGLLAEAWRVRTRLQYSRQIAGDDVVFSQTAVLGAPTSRAQVRSTQWGKDWLSVGIGGELVRMRHWSVFADYNFDLGKHTTSHLGSLNSVITW